MNIVDSIAAMQGELQAIRRDIHAHPELCFEEQRTAEQVANKLSEWGIEHVRGLATTGVVATIKKGDGPKNLGLRADMDGLPIVETNTFDHASQHPGKMHACGHDGHTAMLLGAAHHLQHHADFSGTVTLIFQPAEEGGGGAREMLNEGFLERFPLNAAFAMHNWPGIPLGHFALRDGPVMGSDNTFKIVVHGVGAHAAMAFLGRDPILAGCQIVQGLQSIISRDLPAVENAVISVTKFHAGDAVNVIPECATIEGSVRTFSDRITDQMAKRIGDIATHIAAGLGCRAEFDFHKNYPATVNHHDATELCRRALVDVVGDAQVEAFTPTLGAEDFSFFLQKIPGCYFMIGNGEGDHRLPGHGAGPCTLHNSAYDFNDQTLVVGASAWVALVKRWFAESP